MLRRYLQYFGRLLLLALMLLWIGTTLEVGATRGPSTPSKPPNAAGIQQHGKVQQLAGQGDAEASPIER